MSLAITIPLNNIINPKNVFYMIKYTIASYSIGKSKYLEKITK
jgi:hypothetical protein